MPLNPVRAGMLRGEDALAAYPWSSLMWYAAAREHRPAWVRVDRLLGEHGIKEDTAEGRQEFARRMEQRRLEGVEEASLQEFRREWGLGSESFQLEMIKLMEGKLGDNHPGALCRESGQAKAQRILSEELARLGWSPADLERPPKSDPAKLALAARLRNETKRAFLRSEPTKAAPMGA